MSKQRLVRVLAIATLVLLVASLVLPAVVINGTIIRGVLAMLTSVFFVWPLWYGALCNVLVVAGAIHLFSRRGKEDAKFFFAAMVPGLAIAVATVPLGIDLWLTQAGSDAAPPFPFRSGYFAWLGAFVTFMVALALNRPIFSGKKGRVLAGATCLVLTLAIAVPTFIAYRSYQEYQHHEHVLAQVEAVYKDMEDLKADIVNSYRATGTLPASLLDGLDLAGYFAHSAKYLADVELEGAGIIVTFGNRAAPVLQGTSLVVQPVRGVDVWEEGRPGEFTWHCGDYYVIPGKPILSDGFIAADRTTVPESLIPDDCD